MLKLNSLNWKGLLLGLCGSLLGIGTATAQNPTSVDIDLAYNAGLNRLEVFVRPNGQAFGDVMSGLTYTIQVAGDFSSHVGYPDIDVSGRVSLKPDGSSDRWRFQVQDLQWIQ